MDTFLTPRQREILMLRQAGKTQREIALLMGTTRENISIAEKRAKENIRKAKKTLEEYEQITAVEIDISEIQDFLKLTRAIFKEADALSIKVGHSATDILELLESYVKKHGFPPRRAFLLNSGKISFE